MDHEHSHEYMHEHDIPHDHHEHDAEHAHQGGASHEHSHDAGHSHAHGHAHTHEHTHADGTTHTHEHEHVHEHPHEHEHGHAHGHPHGCPGAAGCNSDCKSCDMDPRAEVVAQLLPLPLPDDDSEPYMPETPEEQVVCFADKFFSKTKLLQEKTYEQAERSLMKFGTDGLERFRQWAAIFM